MFAGDRILNFKYDYLSIDYKTMAFLPNPWKWTDLERLLNTDWELEFRGHRKQWITRSPVQQCLVVEGTYELLIGYSQWLHYRSLQLFCIKMLFQGNLSLIGGVLNTRIEKRDFKWHLPFLIIKSVILLTKQSFYEAIQEPTPPPRGNPPRETNQQPEELEIFPGAKNMSIFHFKSASGKMQH